MKSEELINKLARLTIIIQEAKEIIENLEGYVNGRMIDKCPDVSLQKLLEDSPTVQVRFCNAARYYGVHTVKDLLLYSQKSVLKWRNTGVGCVEEVAKQLKNRYNIIWR